MEAVIIWFQDLVNSIDLEGIFGSGKYHIPEVRDFGNMHLMAYTLHNSMYPSTCFPCTGFALPTDVELMQILTEYLNNIDTQVIHQSWPSA